MSNLKTIKGSIEGYFEPRKECYFKVSETSEEVTIICAHGLWKAAAFYEGHVGELLVEEDGDTLLWRSFAPTDTGKTWYAYAFTDGCIEYGRRVPKKAMVIIKGASEGSVRSAIRGLSRLGYNGEHLVPDVPEADSLSDKYEALCKFTRMVRDTNPYKFNEDE